MMDTETKMVMAFLDAAQPKAEPWTYADARAWIEGSVEPMAQGLRAALAVYEHLAWAEGEKDETWTGEGE